MTKVEAVREELKKLTAAEFVQMRDWILEQDEEQWDREIERDAASGKLDRIFDGSLADHKNGKTHEL